MPIPPPHSATTSAMNRDHRRGAGRRRVADGVRRCRPAPRRPGSPPSRAAAACRDRRGSCPRSRTSPAAPRRPRSAIASSVSRSSRSSVHPSAYWRSGLEPMKAQHSIGMPARCEISAIGWMSAITVRAAQLAVTLQARRRRSRAPAARRRGRRAVRRRAGRCRRCRCRGDRSGAGCASFCRSTGSAPTATAGRRAASRRSAGPARGAGRAPFQS